MKLFDAKCVVTVDLNVGPADLEGQIEAEFENIEDELHAGLLAVKDSLEQKFEDLHIKVEVDT